MKVPLAIIHQKHLLRIMTFPKHRLHVNCISFTSKLHQDHIRLQEPSKVLQVSFHINIKSATLVQRAKL